MKICTVFGPDCHFQNNSVGKQQSRFTLGLNAAKNTHYVKISSSKSGTKKSVSAYVYFPPGGEPRGPKIVIFEILNCKSK